MLTQRKHGIARGGWMRRAGQEGLSPLQLSLAVSVAAIVAILVGLWLAGRGGGLWGLLPVRGTAPAEPPGDVTITSDPEGAQVVVDGKVRGRTPLALRLPGGERRLILRSEGYSDLPVTALVVADRPVAVVGTLWRVAPVLRQLRPPLPGAAIAGAQFLADGRVALTVTLPPGAERQIWIVDAAGGARRVGPAEAGLAVALSPDGERVAYAVVPPPVPGGVLGSEPLADELWIAPAAGVGPGRRHLTLPPSTAAERLVDLAWAPDGRHLLVAAQLRPQGGGVRTRLLWLDADANAAPTELIALPSEIAPGSWTWRPDGGQVAFVARAEGRLALCLLGIGTDQRPGASPLFRYLSELPGTQPPHAAPVAWAPGAGGPFDRVLYAFPTADAQVGSAATGSPALYADDLAGHPPARLGVGAATWPAWRGDGRVLAIAKGKKDAIVLRVVDPAAAGGAGLAADLATLPLGWGGGNGPEVRWDIARGRALLLRPASWGGEAGQLWLLDWRDEGGAVR